MRVKASEHRSYRSQVGVHNGRTATGCKQTWFQSSLNLGSDLYWVSNLVPNLVKPAVVVVKLCWQEFLIVRLKTVCLSKDEHRFLLYPNAFGFRLRVSLLIFLLVIFPLHQAVRVAFSFVRERTFLFINLALSMRSLALKPLVVVLSLGSDSISNGC